MAVAEIATNKKVEGGGDYYVISRSFGLNIGGAIGIALYLSQAVSIAFYIIAFAEAFAPFGSHINETFHLGTIGYLLESKKSNWTWNYVLFNNPHAYKRSKHRCKSIVRCSSNTFLSLVIFFMGESQISLSDVSFVSSIENSDNFFYVFTIIFQRLREYLRDLDFRVI